ncbi:bifunctional folylpolyglutamate synthase/dihydrofolate synthase [Virgibacillus oceani]|uniref:tetrahydrofolate synthase n=1 Tax=Virgibacillus oceani TaxID=1479511 RepID=A0A917GZB9_9BACI|nr:folylpolyglutamate synthase/dihydrofolate synthase family protein [Virgibacillus oceani]GGG62426.1 bifunctional folylpolyglutamate synthase/dihydrofolate synthase [Virgibacillus oceani]
MFKNFQQVETFFENRKRFGIKPGLDRINQLLRLLDNPQNKINAIHVAGTNGKGSTISYLKAALMSNGLQVGVFTSPSMEGLTGHIFIGNTPIDEQKFIALLNEMLPAIYELDKKENYPSEFEIITALAFVYFAKNVDFCVIETGMGGREDTTNCFTPLLSIITNVAKDHIAFLGDTLEKIAYHKAGIIKEKVPVIIGDMQKSAYAVMYNEAIQKNAPIKQLSNDFTYEIIDHTPHLQTFLWRDNYYQFKVAIQMSGEHQLKNASLAIMALVQLEYLGYQLDWSKALSGIRKVIVPGRFEMVWEKPIVIIDGAHNEAGIKSFIQTVLSEYPEKERHLIFAGFKDKELEKMLNLLSDHFVTITVTTFNHPRAAAGEDLYHMLQMNGKIVSSNWKDSLEKIKACDSNNQIFFVTGSLHFIAICRKYFVK